MRYPGQDPENAAAPKSPALTEIRRRVKAMENGDGYWAARYGGQPAAASPSAGLGRWWRRRWRRRRRRRRATPPGSRARRHRQLGRRHRGGMRGALAGMGSLPMVGNVFLKNQPPLMAGPSHIEL
ncbi:hypothetical protein PG984_005636 [Apiospora sp. TS-2023a]